MMRRRLNFTEPTKREAYARSGGICECHRVPELMRLLHGRPCGVALVTGCIEYDHIIADAIRPDNSLENCAALTKTCHALKTPRDRKVIAKSNHQRDRHLGIHSARNRLPGGREDPRKRTMAGVVVDRATGERWGAR